MLWKNLKQEQVYFLALKKKKNCWPMAIKITIGKVIFFLAISTVTCRNSSSQLKKLF